MSGKRIRMIPSSICFNVPFTTAPRWYWSLVVLNLYGGLDLELAPVIHQRTFAGYPLFQAERRHAKKFAALRAPSQF